MLTEQLLENIMTSRPLDSSEVVPLAIAGLSDYLAASFFANQQPECLRLMTMFEQEGGHQRHWLIGYDKLATAKQAALFNGLQAHLLDYDDVHSQVRGHPSAVILSALFSQISLVEHSSLTITGQRFLAAYVVGIEVMARLGVAVGDAHYLKGWHNTSTLGGIAATAAICYLWQVPFTSKAMAIAASQAAGLRLQFGSNIKPLHAGLAAQQAVQSVELCHCRLSANPNFLDAKIGFLTLYGEGNQGLDLADWGKPWRIQSPGLWFKNYSYCSANAYVADAVKAILATNVIDLVQIETIDIAFSLGGDAALIHRAPTIQAQGRFSAEYIIACLLQGKYLSESDFAEQPVDAFTQVLMAKINRRYLAARTPRCVTLTIKLTDQHCLSTTIVDPKGSPANPYNNQEQLAKLSNSLGCRASADRVQLILQQLASTTPVATLIKALREEIRSLMAD